MPSLKRKAGATATASAHNPLSLSKKPKLSDGDELDVTAGMMRAGMMDDMIDDDDDDDDQSEEEDGSQDQDDEDQEMEDGMDDEDVEDWGSHDGSGDGADQEDEEDDDEEGSVDEEAESEDEEGNTLKQRNLPKSQKFDPKSSTKKSLYAPPTTEEMRRLREGEEYGSSGFGFGMKIEAILNSTLLPTTPPATLTTLLSQLHSHISSLPSLPPLPISQATQRLNPTIIPFPEPSPLTSSGEEPKWKLGFEVPKEIFVCGSWGVLGGYKRGKEGKGKGKETLVGGVDLAVVMPESLFTPKDRLNNRYFHKRAHYLSVIASSLTALISSSSAKKGKESKNLKGKKSAAPPEEEVKDFADGNVWEGVKVEWEYVGGDLRRPVVVLRVPKDSSKGLKHSYTVRLLPSITPSVFPASTLYPSKSNLRVSSNTDAEANEPSSNLPTPLYNTAILLETTHRPHLLHLHHLHKSCPAFKSSLALWRIWGERRGLNTSLASGSGWGWLGSMVLGMAIDGGWVGVPPKGKGVRGGERKVKKGLGRGLNEWQLFKAGLEFISSTDFRRTAMYMKTTADADATPPLEFIHSFSDVFVDPTGSINIWLGWERGEIDLLRLEARSTLEMLASATAHQDHFDDVFLKSMQANTLRFDEILRVDVSNAKPRAADPLFGLEQPYKARDLAYSIAGIVRQALGSRATLVTVQAASTKSWSATSPSAQALTSSTLEIGLVLDKSELGRVLDQGPSSDQAEDTALFREFWGEKAELRRFKDGRITESVVWDAPRPEQRVLIPGQVVQWVLQRHFGINKQQVEWRAPQYLPLLQLPFSAHRLVNVEGSEKLGFRPALEAFSSLYKTLKASDDELPLTLLNFTAASEYLRYTSTFIPYPVDLQRAQTAPDCLRTLPALDVIIQFESSRRWPDDLVAMQKIKLAFLENLSRVVLDSLPGVKVNIVLEAGAPDIQDHAALEVIVPEGFAFHLRIYHDRERTLLKRMVEDPELTSEKLRQIAIEAHNHHVRRFSTAPRHHAAIATMHHLYPSFATATRLLKRWLSSHMLSNHIPTEVVELIMAEVYLNPGSYEVPNSAVVGFHRALARLATWNWKEDPIVVPLYTATLGGNNKDIVARRINFPAEDRIKAIKEFELMRKSDPEVVHNAMVVITEEDLAGEAWDMKVKPGKVVLGRIVALAKAAIELLSSEGDVVVQSLFLTPTDQYDFIINLEPQAITKLSQNISAHSSTNISSSWTNHLRNQKVGEDVSVAFNAVELFLMDLERLYGNNILFFYDKLGGTVIGGLWNPASLHLRNFKPFLGFDMKPSVVKGDESSMVEINKEGILDEIKRLGSGLVSSVKVQRV